MRLKKSVRARKKGARARFLSRVGRLNKYERETKEN